MRALINSPTFFLSIHQNLPNSSSFLNRYKSVPMNPCSFPLTQKASSFRSLLGFYTPPPLFSCLLRSTGNEKVQASAVPTSVPVQVAHEMLQAGHHYLDVRTPEEYSAGHPVGAVNVPYMFKVGSGMSKNPDFLNGVSAQFGKDDEIVVGCQAGKRSLMAVTDLISAGYTGITDIAGGYAAWVQNGLPTEK